MISLPSLIAIFLAASSAIATPVKRDLPTAEGTLARRQGGCTEKLQRKAWHTLSNDEKTAYLDAELCLMWHRPSRLNMPSAKSRFDDLVKAHQIQAGLVHGSGWFLPFHRLQMHAHERLLREECGYSGAQPYWDEERDAGKFSQSEIFDPTYGFGGNGRGAEMCIQTGRFANYTLHTGPGYSNTDHCIIRNVSDNNSLASSTENVRECITQHERFETAWPCIEGNPHSGGHRGVGGEMSDGVSSPGDPIFYLHHSFLDRVWWRWQQGDVEARTQDIAGYTSKTRPHSGWVNATLDDELNMFGIIPNAKIRDLMDIGGDLLCMEYV